MTGVRVARSLAFLALCLLCSGVALADDDDDRTWYSRKSKTKTPSCWSWWDCASPSTYTPTKSTTVTAEPDTSGGGIDPTTVPIVDDDLIYMLQVTRDQIHADDAHTVSTGRGVVVAVLDGGFNLNHPDLAGKLSGLGYDAIDDDYDPHDVGNGLDDDGDGVADAGVGHGTFVAGMVLLSAPDATILPIRIRDDEGNGTNAHTLAGLEYARQMGADVINLSISNSAASEGDILDLVVEILGTGVPVVVSAGNASSWIVERALAISEFTLAVGAVDSSDIIAPFSNYALLEPMIYAPGVDLYGPIGAPFDHSRGTWSGTSFAAGIVSGAAALARCVHPDYTPHEIYTHLRFATDWARNAWWWPLSSGRVNLWKVVTQ